MVIYGSGYRAGDSNLGTSPDPCFFSLSARASRRAASLASRDGDASVEHSILANYPSIVVQKELRHAFLILNKPIRETIKGGLHRFGLRPVGNIFRTEGVFGRREHCGRATPARRAAWSSSLSFADP